MLQYDAFGLRLKMILLCCFIVSTAIFSPITASSAIQGDINNDGRIDTTEAIFALQVAAGLFPGISTSCVLSGRGDWSTNTFYGECDVVFSGGENYVCNSLHTSSGIAFSNDIENWDLLSLKGDTGAIGPQGPVGQAKGLSIGNEVTHTIDGIDYVWLDRNLGASQVATTFNDVDAYGDLYQWGRGVDGHENRESPTTTVLSSSDAPKHDNFITTSSSPADWRIPQNGNLWQGVSGINNPCPAGFRLPTETEWEIERGDWIINNSAGAFDSPLKLVLAGFRSYNNGTLSFAGSTGIYWSSTVDGNYARRLYFGTSDAYMNHLPRAYGFSVRCLKD